MESRERTFSGLYIDKYGMKSHDTLEECITFENRHKETIEFLFNVSMD